MRHSGGSKAKIAGGGTPRYSFVLNPHASERFTRCPRCENTTRVRKIPLVIHIDSVGLVTLRKTCRLCVVCEALMRIEGSYGIYRTWLQLGRRTESECSCPSGWRPRKHVRALRMTWDANPDSFFTRGLEFCAAAAAAEAHRAVGVVDMLRDVVSAQPLSGHRLHVTFDDGVEGIVNVAQLVPFTGVFEPLRDSLSSIR